MTKDEAQRRRWTFYEAVKLNHLPDELRKAAGAGTVVDLAIHPCDKLQGILAELNKKMPLFDLSQSGNEEPQLCSSRKMRNC